ncbi:phosphopantetheine-binding protein [Microbulbifer sp. SAOS-129_SWC]|uniref:acyl carrier protein n=1 Tax=Microbulbifer sp. SAOS-129_SWC TaxID=3145235 RepID=UPI003217CFF6
MTRDEIRALTLEKLLQVAPDIDPQQLEAKTPIRDQYDFDSMDFLNFAIAVGREFQLDIPEQDYNKLQSLDDTVDYLQQRIGGSASGE